MAEFNKYCYIDNKDTNACADSSFMPLYQNKASEVYKININQKPTLERSKPINKGDSLPTWGIPDKLAQDVDSAPVTNNNNTNNNTNNISKLSNNLNYKYDNVPFNNSTLEYASIGHRPDWKSTYAEPVINN